ncbi:MAG: DUF84 family protein [Candidatus Shapirobacteria bacterium]
MKIALGTGSERKRAVLEGVLVELGVKATIESFEVLSGVANQPISSKETKRGAINRAKNALAKFNEADCSLGIEVGYQKNRKSDYEMLCWAALISRDGKRFLARSHKLLLPKFHQNILKKNKELGDFVRQYLAENPDPVCQHIGIIIKDRIPFIETAVKLVLLKYLVV